MLIEALPYFDRYGSDEARGHLGFHNAHLQRLLTRDQSGQFDGLRDLVWQVRSRLSQVRTPTITLGCYCDYGAVESVGLTWFLVQALEFLGYVPMNPLFFGRQSSWPSVPCQQSSSGCWECLPDADSEAKRGLNAVLGSLAAGVLGDGCVAA